MKAHDQLLGWFKGVEQQKIFLSIDLKKLLINNKLN